MTIDKAIETLEQYRREGIADDPLDFVDAIKLGREALKRVVEYRGHHPLSKIKLLPSETKLDNRDEQELDERRLDALLSK